MRIERHDLHGTGQEDGEVYDMPARPPDYWAAVTNVPCPMVGCEQTVVWYEAGYVPGYRVCMNSLGDGKWGKRRSDLTRPSKFETSGSSLRSTKSGNVSASDQALSE